MSTIENTTPAALAEHLRLPPRLVMLALVMALAAAALSVALVTSGGSGSVALPASHAAVQRQHFGGPAEGRGLRSKTPSAPANDGGQHFGARP
jgi:hypothetical protein